MIDSLIIRRPDDWHVHLRDGDMLSDVVNYTARQFARAIVMPNLTPPVTTVAAGRAYRQRIMDAVAPSLDFTPLMVCYLTDTIDADEIARGHAEGVFTACKLYPANATTNSSAGVTDVKNIYPVLEAMQKIGMPLLVHGEVTHHDVDIFDREAVFISDVLKDVVKDFPDLKIVFEHITTAEAAEFVTAAGPNIAATIFSKAVFARIIIACPLPSVKSIASRCAKPPHQALRNFSSAQTPPRIRLKLSKALAVVQGYLMPLMLWRLMPKSLMRKMRWISSKVLPLNLALAFTAFRSMKVLSPSSAKRPLFQKRLT